MEETNVAEFRDDTNDDQEIKYSATITTTSDSSMTPTTAIDSRPHQSTSSFSVPNDHASMAAAPPISTTTTALDAAAAMPGTSAPSSMSNQFAFGKAPKRRNLRHVLEPAEFGTETLEERKREMERQQRVQMLMAARFQHQQLLQQQQQQQQHAQFHHHSYHAFPPPNANYLTDREQAEIASRQAVWRNFKTTKSVEDVVVLSSDDEENEAKRFKKRGSEEGEDSDDCVCLGSDDEAPETEQAIDEVAATAHVNDDFNVPDGEGRVLINVGHAESEPDVFLSQHLVGNIKPHQIGGLRFMYDNVVESIEKLNPNGGFGCILAHSMGLGKTFQIVTFTEILYRHTSLKRVLLIVPVNTLQNWLHEYEMWLPKSSFQRDVPPRQFDVWVIADGCKTMESRVAVINDWYRKSGVLIMGYEMFRMLTNKVSGVCTKKPKPHSAWNHHQNGTTANSTSQESRRDDESSNNIDLKELAKALIDPGPDIVVCDEGHRIKNFQSHTSRALSNIRTKRRIVLTGYPLQNNLMEYWCMVNFVRPNYLGTRQEFASVFERPIRNGQCVDSTERDVRFMRYRVHVLTNLLRGFVQRRSHSLLNGTLPPKCEYVLFVRKSPIQHRLYRRFIVECTADMREDVSSWNPLKAFAVCCKIWNHPDVLYRALKNHVDAVDGDFDMGGRCGSPSATSSNGTSGKSMAECASSSTMSNGFFQFRTAKDRRHIDYRWAEDLFENYVPGLIENGMKMRLALKIIEHSVGRSDKILLFSQSLLTLDAIETFLNAMLVPGTSEKWKKNRSYFRLDGSTNSMERQRLIARFNNERGVHLFLISTRAGSLGINLVGANRCIVFDASFNPCHDAQAVCRVYRYGQKKPTFIYRLVADNSMEKTIFNRQLGKQGIADRVIDERAMDAALRQQDLYDLLQYKEEDDMVTENCTIDPEKVKDELLVTVCQEDVDCLAKAPVEHESLMLDRGDQKLSDSEKREAKRAYEREKKMMKGGASGNGGTTTTTGVDWKKWQAERNNKASPDLGQRRTNWQDYGPPQIHSTPVPMMLQQSSSYPRMVSNTNGYGTYSQFLANDSPAVPVWYPPRPQMQHSQPPPVFPRPTRPPNNDVLATEGPPELITLSDDES